MSEKHDPGNKQQLPGRGIKWQHIAEVPCPEYESERRHSIQDSLLGKSVTKRQDGVTHGKIVFYPSTSSMTSSQSQSSKQTNAISSSSPEDVPCNLSSNLDEANSISLVQSTVSDSEDCVVLDSFTVSSTPVSHSGANKLVISTTIPKHIPSSVSLKALVQVILEYNGHKRGLDTMWKHMGVETNVGHSLYPEEALFLMQAGEFRALCPNNRVLSVQHALAMTKASYAMFRVYSKLCGAALKPVRHQPHVGITSYEKKIKLDQHNKFKKRKASVSEPPPISASSVTTISNNSFNCSGTPHNTNPAELPSVVSIAKSADSKDDLDVEMMAFYSSIEEETKVKNDTHIDNTAELKDEMEYVEEIEDTVTDAMVIEYERSKQLILRDLPSMNPTTGECRIIAAASFLPSSLKVLTEDYIVLKENIYQYSKRALRANGNFKMNMNPFANTAQRSNPEPTIAADSANCDSDISSEILDSDTETSSSSDSESVSSLSDSEDVCYQGWYTNWNNVIYMKRIMATSDPADYDAGKRDLDEPNDRSDKSVKHARCDASPRQEQLQHTNTIETPDIAIPNLNQCLPTGAPILDCNDIGTSSTIETHPASAYCHPEMANSGEADIDTGNKTRDLDLSASATDSSSSSSTSSSESSSSDSEDSSVEDVLTERGTDSPLDSNKPASPFNEEVDPVGNAVVQTDDSGQILDIISKNICTKKVSWENPVGDFLDIFGQTLKRDGFEKTSKSLESTSSTQEETVHQATGNGSTDSAESKDSSTVSSVINLIRTVRKGTTICDSSLASSAKYMKQEMEEVRDNDQSDHRLPQPSGTRGGLVASSVCAPPHPNTYQKSISTSKEGRVVVNVSVTLEDDKEDLRMSLPDHGPNRRNQASRGSGFQKISNKGRPGGRGGKLISLKGAAVRSVQSAPNGELRVSLGCASISGNDSFKTGQKGKKVNKLSKDVQNNQLTMDPALQERLGEKCPAWDQQDSVVRDPWKPASEYFGSPQKYNRCVPAPTSDLCKKQNQFRGELLTAGVVAPPEDLNYDIPKNSGIDISCNDANYHEVISPSRKNFRDSSSHTEYPLTNNKRGLSSPRGLNQGNLSTKCNLLDNSFGRGGRGEIEARGIASRGNFNNGRYIEPSRGSYSGGPKGAAPGVAHGEENAQIDRERSSTPEAKGIPFPPPCFGGTFLENQRWNESQSFNQNTNHWRGNQNDSSWMNNHSQDIRYLKGDSKFGAHQQGSNAHSGISKGQAFNSYSSRGRGQINKMPRENWKGPPDYGSGPSPRGGGGQWNNRGRGFKKDFGGSSQCSSTETPSASKSRGRGGDGFQRGRGGDGFHQGRGGDGFHRGRGDGFHRGRGEDGFPQGRGEDGFHRGKGGDRFHRGRGGNDYNRVRGKGSFMERSGGANATSSNNTRGTGRGNARQQARQGRWNYWQTFKAQKSALDQSIVHNVNSWHEYKSAVQAKKLEGQQRRPSKAALFTGNVKPIITPTEGHAPTLGAVLAKVRDECPSNSTSSDLSEWLQQEAPEAAALYTPSNLPQVSLDVYSCKSNYSRSKPTIPEFRVVLAGEETDANFSACHVLGLRRHHADSADLALATNAESTGRVRHVAILAMPASDGRLRPHALTWSKKLYERR